MAGDEGVVTRSHVPSRREAIIRRFVPHPFGVAPRGVHAVTRRSALRCPCYAQAQGGRQWPPVERMRSTPGGCGEDLRRLCSPAPLQAWVRHCASLSCFAQARGIQSLDVRSTHAYHPWRTRSAHAPSPVFHAPSNTFAFRSARKGNE